MDKLEIEITPEGIIKTSTNKISMVNHSGAEGFLLYLARLAGGKSSRVHKHGGTAHSHHHGEEHHHH